MNEWMNEWMNEVENRPMNEWYKNTNSFFFVQAYAMYYVLQVRNKSALLLFEILNKVGLIGLLNLH